MNKTITDKTTFNDKIMNLYTFCCSGIRKMPTMEAKRFAVRLAVHIHSLIHQNVQTCQNLRISSSTKATAIQLVNQQVQADCRSQNNILRLPTIQSQISIKSKEDSGTDNDKDHNDEILEETIQKYESLIESLYQQIQDLQGESDRKISLIKFQSQKKIIELQKNMNSNRCAKTIRQSTNTKCNCPVAELTSQINRLEKQIKKRDKIAIKKLKQKN